jgi:hypothetical protein
MKLKRRGNCMGIIIGGGAKNIRELEHKFNCK